MSKPILTLALTPVVMFVQSVPEFWFALFLAVAWATSRERA